MTTALTTPQPLFEANYTARTVTALQPFHDAIATALEKACLIGRVSNEEENATMTEALVECEAVLKLAEQARTEAKKPILDFGRRIDEYFKALVAEVVNERTRLGTMGGNYHTLKLQQARAREALRVAELNEIERRTQEQLAQAKSHDEIDAIQARANQEVQAVPQPVAPVRAHRQTVTPDVDFEVFDLDAVYRSHPNCVKMEPKRTEIKALLKAGVQIPGVRAIETVRVGVRLPVAKVVNV